MNLILVSCCFFVGFLAWKAKLVIAKIMEEMENDDDDEDDDDDDNESK